MVFCAFLYEVGSRLIRLYSPAGHLISTSSQCREAACKAIHTVISGRNSKKDCLFLLKRRTMTTNKNLIGQSKWNNGEGKIDLRNFCIGTRTLCHQESKHQRMNSGASKLRPVDHLRPIFKFVLARSLCVSVIISTECGRPDSTVGHSLKLGRVFRPWCQFARSSSMNGRVILIET